MDKAPFLNIEYFFEKIYQFLFGTDVSGFAQSLHDFFIVILPYTRFASVGLILLFLAGIVYVSLQMKKIHIEIREKYLAEYRALHTEATASDGGNVLRWNRIIEHAESQNPNDWMSAILEADIILAELLEAEGAIGDGVGEKLRGLTRGNLRTLDSAWEAHRMRNSLAHEGASVLMNNREVMRILALYQSVFEELKFI